MNSSRQPSADYLVGKQLKNLRLRRGFSLRTLAEHSDLNVNALGLIEKGKSSPSVSTLQQLALALRAPITAFFESEPVEKHVVFTPADQRPTQTFGSTEMQNLGQDLAGNGVQPFIVTLQPNMGSGDYMIVHTGFKSIYCLCGTIHSTRSSRKSSCCNLVIACCLKRTCPTAGKTKTPNLIRL
jgi:transcriptional regulator with XRE-family HTH domain